MLPQRQLLPRALIVAVFALSCFTILVFLWSTFGGPVPLRAQGYRVKVPFDEATTLGVQAEVRLSGVPIGRVVDLQRTENGLTEATLQIDPGFTPLRTDTRATLRQKSLAGETYVEVSAGDPSSAAVPDRGSIPARNVEPTVQLDEVFRTFTPRVRAAFKTWIEQQALAGAGRGRVQNEALAQLAPLEQQATQLLTTVRANDDALRTLVRDTGVVFAALSERRADLQSLIRSADRVFETTAQRNDQLAATFEAFPAFERESRATLDALTAFADGADPLVTQLQGVAKEATPTFEAAGDLAPDLRALLDGLGSAQSAGENGLPAADDFLGSLTGFTQALPSPLTQLNPFLGYVGSFKDDLISLVANSAAATNAFVNQGRGKQHYLRGLTMLMPEGLAHYPQRLSSNRVNPYPLPRSSNALYPVQPSFDTAQCTGAPWPSVQDGPGVPQLAIDTVRKMLGDGTPIGPPCIQSPLRNGKRFPQLVPDPTPTTP